MDTRPLGDTGLEVSCIGLGGMPMSLRGRPSEDESVRVIHAALDHGMTFIDTADVYCQDHTDIGHNERLVARALREWSGGSEIVVATKGGLERPDGDWTTNGRPEHLRSACEASLRALGVEAITLYQFHAPCDQVPFADSVGELSRLRAEGKIQHVGLSNVSIDELTTAQTLVPIVSVQNRCNPHDTRAWSGGVLARCEADGVVYLPYSPVGGGRGLRRVGSDAALNAVGARHGASPYEVALAWLLASSPAMIPIPGASKVSSATSSARAADLTLSDLDMTELDGAFL